MMKRVSNRKPGKRHKEEINLYMKKDEAIVEKVVKLGFPPEYVAKCLQDNMNNHCTTAYYLLMMDQNYSQKVTGAEDLAAWAKT